MTWRERIQSARERGAFTIEDKKMAAQWTTCAVGEQREALPDVVIYTDMMNIGIPQDDSLYALGGGTTGFYCAVHEDDMNRAESLLDRIEDRVLQMKRAL